MSRWIVTITFETTTDPSDDDAIQSILSDIYCWTGETPKCSALKF